MRWLTRTLYCVQIKTTSHFRNQILILSKTATTIARVATHCQSDLIATSHWSCSRHFDEDQNYIQCTKVLTTNHLVRQPNRVVMSIHMTVGTLSSWFRVMSRPGSVLIFNSMNLLCGPLGLEPISFTSTKASDDQNLVDNGLGYLSSSSTSSNMV